MAKIVSGMYKQLSDIRIFISMGIPESRPLASEEKMKKLV